MSTNRDEIAAAYSGVVAPPAKERRNPFPRVQPWYKRAVALQAAGFGNTEIADILQKTSVSVSTALQHPDLQSYKEDLADIVARETLSDARGIIAEHTSEAAMALVYHMRSETESVSLRATESILDRGGIPKAETRLVPPSLQLPKGELNDIRAALTGMKEEVPELVEVEGTAAVMGQEGLMSDG